MPITVPEATDDLVAQAQTKSAEARRNLPRYLWLSALAGAFVGVAVVLLLSVSAPLVADNSPMAKLVQGAVFGIALTLVVFAGAELFTGNAMVMPQGVLARRVRMSDLILVWVASLVGNFGGSIGFAALVHGGGTLKGPGASLVASIVKAKDAASGGQLFWRSVLCNMLVCLALWMAARAKTDGAKLAVLWWALLAFISSGFEHSIANMTIFGLGIFEHSATWSMLFRNLLWTVPGNIVGGGLVIGVGYAWVGGVRARAGASAEPVTMAADIDLTPEPAIA